jgi:PPOX class probable F420-dependent enzyme
MIGKQRFRERLEQSRFAVLGTTSADGSPHLVPVVFAIDGNRLVSAIDHKPKTTTLLRRLANIERNPTVTVLVDHRDDDWSTLWWVRVDGQATVVSSGSTYESGLDLLVARYEPYVDRRPTGPLINIIIERISGWDAWSSR